MLFINAIYNCFSVCLLYIYYLGYNKIYVGYIKIIAYYSGYNIFVL